VSRNAVAIIGAGPAGLAAGYVLTREGAGTIVCEAGGEVGGLARSMDLWGQRVDLGPHRFFSRDRRVNGLWLEVVGRDYGMVDRRTRILYGGKLYRYPLEAWDALSKLGVLRAAGCLGVTRRSGCVRRRRMGRLSRGCAGGSGGGCTRRFSGRTASGCGGFRAGSWTRILRRSGSSNSRWGRRQGGCRAMDSCRASDLGGPVCVSDGWDGDGV
jgi:hypothetical protein